MRCCKKEVEFVCEEKKVFYLANLLAETKTNKPELRRCLNVLGCCFWNTNWNMPKQRKEGAYSNCDKGHPAFGFSYHQRDCPLQAAGTRAPLCSSLLSIHSKPLTPLPGLALTQIWVGTTNTGPQQSFKIKFAIRQQEGNSEIQDATLWLWDPAGTHKHHV